MSQDSQDIWDWWLDHHDKIVEYDVNKSRFKFKRTKEAKVARDLSYGLRNYSRITIRSQQRGDPWQKHAADALMYTAGFTSGVLVGIRSGPLTATRAGLKTADMFVKIGDAFYNYLLD